jgi:uncharacterized protein with HEPN domain
VAAPDRHPEIPWADIRGSRNILVHQYFDASLENVWETVQRDLPALEHALEAVLASEA